MKYVITGGAGNISRPLATGLLKSGHQVTVIGRNAAHLKELADAGATIAVGNLEDLAFLTETFTGADAVYTMVPPMHAADDWKAAIAAIGSNYVEAIRKTGIKHVVNLSSIGADLPDGVGPVSGLYKVEQALNTLEQVNILHLRPAYFYVNLLANINMIKQLGFMGSNFALPEGKFPIVAPADIADVALKALLELDFKGHSARYIASDEVSTDRIAAELGKAIGKPDLKWVLFTDAQTQDGMLQAGLHPEIAKNYVEMGQAMNSGIMTEDYFKHHPSVTGKTKLGDFAKVFAGIYQS